MLLAIFIDLEVVVPVVGTLEFTLYVKCKASVGKLPSAKPGCFYLKRLRLMEKV